ncbi:hypothetical protein [Sphingomonas phyllosphaerae]|uniref:hypothetical protein n=1 Tax=Sphingomonas phyllosphaerae TaxID=257003 RepID=UPI0018C99665|nr:hypothetical protein [Sphingomonas phyllosphaerae]
MSTSGHRVLEREGSGDLAGRLFQQSVRDRPEIPRLELWRDYFSFVTIETGFSFNDAFAAMVFTFSAFGFRISLLDLRWLFAMLVSFWARRPPLFTRFAAATAWEITTRTCAAFTSLALWRIGRCPRRILRIHYDRVAIAAGRGFGHLDRTGVVSTSDARLEYRPRAPQ